MVGNGNWPIATAVAATQLGNARRALDEATTVLMTKAPMPDLTPLASNGAVQRGLAELEGRWNAAHTVVEAELVAMWDEATADGELSIDRRIRLHRANIAANRTSVEIVDRLCELTGTTSVDRRHPLARAQRDALALRSHISVGSASMEHNTRVALGLEPSHRLV
jgi:alkylation response protein AidB-like acyl-CoA dehydrogenase